MQGFAFSWYVAQALSDEMKTGLVFFAPCKTIFSFHSAALDFWFFYQEKEQ
ncbi:MAG: hypothetical protein JWQ27_752 [Ferruginibacter sp.]|nr:hypothetical protein [Ferruginibacter sp.]